MSSVHVLRLGLGLLLLGVVASSLVWPRAWLVGGHGVHPRTEAGCLDCHVPFLGTPKARCLGPGCHGNLATGTPPQDGPALPVRFHSVVRELDCSGCHTEHQDAPPRASGRPQAHALPPSVLQPCAACHPSESLLSEHPIEENCAGCHPLSGLLH